MEFDKKNQITTELQQEILTVQQDLLHTQKGIRDELSKINNTLGYVAMAISLAAVYVSFFS